MLGRPTITLMATHYMLGNYLPKFVNQINPKYQSNTSIHKTLKLYKKLYHYSD